MKSKRFVTNLVRMQVLTSIAFSQTFGPLRRLLVVPTFNIRRGVKLSGLKWKIFRRRPEIADVRCSCATHSAHHRQFPPAAPPMASP